MKWLLPLRVVKALPLLGAWAATAAYGGSMELAAGDGTFRVPVASLKELRFQSTLRQRLDFSCGSAAVASLLSFHYQHPVDEQSVFNEMYAHGDQDKIRREGFSLLDIKKFLKTRGFNSDGFEAPLEELDRNAVPAIALINENGYNHFVVIKGLRQGRVLIGDSASGTRAISRGDFEAMWRSRILFIIVDPFEHVVFNDPHEWSVTPRGPLSAGISRTGLDALTVPRLSRGDF